MLLPFFRKVTSPDFREDSKNSSKFSNLKAKVEMARWLNESMDSLRLRVKTLRRSRCHYCQVEDPPVGFSKYDGSGRYYF